MPIFLPIVITAVISAISARAAKELEHRQNKKDISEYNSLILKRYNDINAGLTAARYHIKNDLLSQMRRINTSSNIILSGYVDNIEYNQCYIPAELDSELKRVPPPCFASYIQPLYKSAIFGNYEPSVSEKYMVAHAAQHPIAATLVGIRICIEFVQVGFQKASKSADGIRDARLVYEKLGAEGEELIKAVKDSRAVIGSVANIYNKWHTKYMLMCVNSALPWSELNEQQKRSLLTLANIGKKYVDFLEDTAKKV